MNEIVMVKVKDIDAIISSDYCKFEFLNIIFIHNKYKNC